MEGRGRDDLLVSLENQTHTGRNALTPAVFQYEDANEIDLSSPQFLEWTTAGQNINWFLYRSGFSGAMMQSVWNADATPAELSLDGTIRIIAIPADYHDCHAWKGSGHDLMAACREPRSKQRAIVSAR